MKSLDEMQVILNKSKCIVDWNAINLALDSLAAAITSLLEKTNPLILCVMSGALIPAGHLLTRLSFPLEIDYIHATRYQGKTYGGELQWRVQPRYSLKDRTILVIDDIMDGGLTLQHIVEFCQKAGAHQVYSAVMVNKKRVREPGVTLEPDFVGVETEDLYLFGFGLDYEECFRNLPGIYAVQE